MERLRAVLDGASSKAQEYQEIAGAAEAQVWRSVREFLWVKPDHTLVKVPVTPRRVTPLDSPLTLQGALRRYNVGGNVAWVAWPGPPSEIHNVLAEQGLSGLVLLGPVDQPFIGVSTGEAFAQRVKNALDPKNKFAGTS
jgi:hypothetical protein